ncbi:tubulin-folding cofactor B-like [Ornithodoros turicata]|uniref:tubulin-folding cofactor B-like n=1 Tax=Ornithodoros turicata TaxID=34597 RepID=UPI00313874D5
MSAMGDFVPAFVRFTVVTEGTEFMSDRKFPVTSTIADLKMKLELLTGASVHSMQLELRRSDGTTVAALKDDSARLESFPITDGLTLHVSDPHLNHGEPEDFSLDERDKISEERYNQLNESARKFLQEQGFRTFNEEQKDMLRKIAEEKEKKKKELLKVIQIGNRCEVHGVKQQPARHGTVMFVGEVDFKPGVWVGVKYDLPLGKNDGSVNGKRYFECLPKYGGFVRPVDLTIGDFPPDDDIDGELDLEEL